MACFSTYTYDAYHRLRVSEPRRRECALQKTGMKKKQKRVASLANIRRVARERFEYGELRPAQEAARTRCAKGSDRVRTGGLVGNSTSRKCNPPLSFARAARWRTRSGAGRGVGENVEGDRLTSSSTKSAAKHNFSAPSRREASRNALAEERAFPFLINLTSLCVSRSCSPCGTVPRLRPAARLRRTGAP